ncbi:hypothetical protein COT20_01620 [bacterium (Candidatus Gribaldobacteria) CG08_land_8_20_14_0_20_39_15]|uniref:Thioredoxin-like fold domain-containing protein n=1 Tax=bacterium (Candidatus Gribaldobacteria) CG08_land_8_20_14_0_20_39_15 TaxID=2014273 RepID=A0A2M6XUR0_9BACT|nr:MAG: hypothetical protein COT20_01620 [bacterium (Candidatus Gribaldobacteria) CG08_land_8_20_14_0_20_39_15]
MKKIHLAIFIAVGLIAGVWLLTRQPNSPSNVPLQCQIKEMIFYYADICSWCQKVKDEGTITEIKDLGVRVKEVNVAIGPVRHQFQGVPTFIINDKAYSGYRTFEELKELLGCPGENNGNAQNSANQN